MLAGVKLCKITRFLADGHGRQDSMDFSNEWSDVPMKPLDRRRLRDANRHVARSLVGTPNYIAPEVLLREGEELFRGHRGLNTL